MKTKILLSSALIAILPLVANATGNQVGPSAASGTPVYATASAPYQTVEILPDDATQVVSASYVKGAYNDTIAAINTVWDEVDLRQVRLENIKGDMEMSNLVADVNYFVNDLDTSNILDDEEMLISVAAVAAGIKSQRVTAVDTWGSNHTVDVAFKTVQ